MQNVLILLIDSALFLLIWLVQIIIYPSFKYVAEDKLSNWHSNYKMRITVFVLPLMFGQVMSYAYLLQLDFNLLSIIAVFFIALAWLVTFFKEVPLHNKIGNEQDTKHSINALIEWNWPRTISWSLVFFISIYRSITI